MDNRIDKIENFIREIFGKAPKNTMKHQNGLDEIDLAAAQEGNSEYKLNFLRPRTRFNTVIQ